MFDRCFAFLVVVVVVVGGVWWILFLIAMFDCLVFLLLLLVVVVVVVVVVGRWDPCHRRCRLIAAGLNACPDAVFQLCVPISLLFLNGNDQLQPIAIQLFQQPGPNNPVSTSSPFPIQNYVCRYKYLS